jgi:hypothetical protein
VAEKQQQKRINVDQVVSFLNHTFAKAMQKSGVGNKNHKGTLLYNYQVEFAHLVNEIQRGPVYITPKLITEANDLIERLANDPGEEVEAGQ